MREPSVHISHKNLVLVFKKIFKEEVFTHNSLNALATQVLTIAKPYSINNRTIIPNTKKVEKEVNKVLRSSRLDADLMANLIVSVRRKLKHRGIQQILPNSKDWNLVKNITQNANNFCDEFNLNQREGFIEYLQIGISKMNKFGLVKLTNMYESICLTYDSKLLITQDETPLLTKTIHDYYVQKTLEQTGLYEDYTKIPEKYIYFVKVKEKCEELGVKGQLWVEAQFWGLEWKEGKPDVVQLIGNKAFERFSKYCYENKIKVSRPENKVDFSKIRKYGKDNTE